MTTKTMTNTSTSTSSNGHGPCRCYEAPPQPCCCNLVCFDRPNYFCGHLLTDADLTLQQKYAMEKNKLYHRTMDGYGVVCGLKLTCDCDCKGNILVHDGFAIDNCGNDLIVCETTPFDVIAALKSKGYPLFDDSDDYERRPHGGCDSKQCYYITICYQETESAYETPFQSSCSPGPKSCMPTRIHEGFRLDVTDKMPPGHSYFDQLEERMRHCFDLLCDSPFGVILKRCTPHVLELFGEPKTASEKPREQEECDLCEMFCTLRAYFLNYLKTNPDRFNCNVYDEVSCLSCPREWSEEWVAYVKRRNTRRARGEEIVVEELKNLKYNEQLRDVFNRLLYLMQRYVFDCVFGDLVFSCPQPCQADCLVLGTVEVVNGKLVRVCNTPRRYLWAPANLPQVLIYSLMTEHLHANEKCDERGICCCPDYSKFEPIPFLREFEINQCGRYHAAKSSLDSLSAGLRSFYAAHEFTDSAAISPQIFSRVPAETLSKVAAQFGVTASQVERKAAELSAPTLYQALQSYALLRPSDAIVAYTSEGQSHRIIHDFVAELSPDRSVGRHLEKDPDYSRQRGDQLAKQLDDLRAEVDALRQKLANIEKPQKAGKKSGPASKKSAEEAAE